MSIERFDCNSEMYHSNHGSFVRYDDHAAELAAERTKVERLRMAGRSLLDCPHIAERDMEPAWAESETEKAVAEMRAALEAER